MFEPDITDMQQPVVDEAQFRVIDRSLYAATPVVTTDNNVFNFEDINGILNNREAVEVGVDDQVGHITVDK